MDKDYLAKRLIYLTGRSDPHRINSVFERVLDNYINESIPYKFNSLKKLELLIDALPNDIFLW